jgi:antitoxin VapB
MTNDSSLDAAAERGTKLERLRDLLIARDLDAIALHRTSSLAWLTGGATVYVNTASTTGPVAALVRRDGTAKLVTNDIEAPRLAAEEPITGFEIEAAPWHELGSPLGALVAGLRVGCDGFLAGATDLSDDLARLRARLLPCEHARLRDLGQRAAAAMDAAIRTLRPGQRELEIAGLLAGEAQRRGVQAVVNLVATDRRIVDFRHPLPTEKPLQRHAMLVLGGRRQGLVASLTRLVHFGPLPGDLRRRSDAVAAVDTALIQASRPGAALADVLAHGIAAYAQSGYPDEWRRHHQGGLAGYEPREVLVRPSTVGRLEVGHACAWNPSIAGAKSEDTILIGVDVPEVVTATPGWPTLAGAPGLPRPDVLVVD